MTAISPVAGGHYRFIKIGGDSTIYIGIVVGIQVDHIERFVCAVNLYVEALTQPNDVPPEFSSLIGLPDLKRHPFPVSFNEISFEEVLILDRIYVCKNSVYQKRRVQWRVGMRNLYRISDDEEDEHLLFNGFGEGVLSNYINEEHDYLVFKILLVKVRKSTSPLCIH